MDKNTITGFILLALTFIAFGWYNQPSDEQIAEAARQDSIAKAAQAKAEADKKSKQQQAAAVQMDSAAAFFAASKGKSQDIILKNDKLQLTVSTKGGTVTKAVIKGFLCGL